MIRWRHLLPEGRAFSPLGLQVIDIAPEGQHFVYSTTSPGIYLRARDELDDRPIPIQGPSMPVLSPDGQSLAYYAWFERNLTRVSLSGGPTSVLAGTDGEVPSGASWGADGTVLYALGDGIWQVPENGGEPERLIATEAGERFYGPSRLPGSEWVLFTMVEGIAAWDDANIVVALPSTD